MKILFLYGHDWGGSFVLTQADALKKGGHQVTIICPGEGPFTRACMERGLEVYVSPFQGSSIRDIPRIIRSMLDIVTFIRRNRPDVVHYHLIKAIIIGRICAFIGRVPKRYSQLGGPLSLEMKIFRWLDLATAFIDTGIICPSIGVMNIYQRHRVARGKTSLLYYGFDQIAFAEKKICDRSIGRKALGLSDDDLVVIMVAYMYGADHKRFKDVSLKGHETLIAAADKILSRHPNAKFLIVGEDPDGGKKNFNRLSGLTEKLGLRDSFIFTGHRKDVPQLISLADVAVVASLSENCGGAVEPFASGVPVVASDTGGLPELVLPGITGFLFQPGNPADLANALDEALSLSPGQRQNLGVNGQKLVAALFDPALCKEAQLSIYETRSDGQMTDYHMLIQSLPAPSK